MEKSSLGDLSAREVQILEQVATGATNQQIAHNLGISVNTVKAHLRNIYGKLQVESRTEATLAAIQGGMIRVHPPIAEPASADSVLEGRSTAHSTRTASLQPAPHPAQYASLVLALVIAVVFWVWPFGGESQNVPESPLVDRPMVSLAQSQMSPDSRWRPRAQMPTPRGRFAQAVYDGKIYVLGGLGEEGWSSRLEVYDPALDLWDRLAPLPTAVANVSAVAVNGVLYVPGGLDDDERVLDTMAVYDMAQNIWRQGPLLPTPLCGYAIAPHGEGFYVLGGWDGDAYSSAVLHFDVIAGQWEWSGSLSVSRAFLAAAAHDGLIYVAGGHDGNREYALLESYDPGVIHLEERSRRFEPMRASRAGHAMCATGGELYVVGGSPGEAAAFGERYSVQTGEWRTFESPGSGQRTGLGLSALTVDRMSYLYAIGGWLGRYLGDVASYQTSFRVYVPQQGRQSSVD